jgi:uncharacterized protein
VQKDLESLLAVQADDAGIRAIGERVADVDRRLRALDDERVVAVAAVERARVALEREEAKRGALQARVEEHRQLHQRNLTQLDQVRRLREATAAQTQVDMARQILNEEERELQALARRIEDQRQALTAHEAALADIDERQQETRATFAAEREALDAQAAEARAKREDAARRVPRGLLSRYERIRDRRGGEAVFPLRGSACSSCDTAIPMQRRNLMADGSMIEVCEGCGVLLYAAAQ